MFWNNATYFSVMIESSSAAPVIPTSAGSGTTARAVAQTKGDQLLDKIVKALPDKAPAQPKQPRKILIYSKTAGFRHSSIPSHDSAGAEPQWAAALDQPQPSALATMEARTGFSSVYRNASQRWDSSSGHE